MKSLIIMGKPQLNLKEYKTQYYLHQSTINTKNIKRFNNIITDKCNNSKEDQKVVE